jgi:hypothetical protein
MADMIAIGDRASPCFAPLSRARLPEFCRGAVCIGLVVRGARPCCGCCGGRSGRAGVERRVSQPVSGRCPPEAEGDNHRLCDARHAGRRHVPCRRCRGAARTWGSRCRRHKPYRCAALRSRRPLTAREPDWARERRRAPSCSSTPPTWSRTSVRILRRASRTSARGKSCFGRRRSSNQEYPNCGVDRRIRVGAAACQVFLLFRSVCCRLEKQRRFQTVSRGGFWRAFVRFCAQVRGAGVIVVAASNRRRQSRPATPVRTFPTAPSPILARPGRFCSR